MFTRSHLLIYLSLVLFEPGSSVVFAQDQPTQLDPNGLTVLARGPIHEAYAMPVEANPQPSPDIPRQPPDPVAEVPPDQKPDDPSAIWIPGYWDWDSNRNDFIWVSGIWRRPPQGRQWVPGYWTHASDGWQWVPGFWAGAEQEQVSYLDQAPPASLDNGPSEPAPDDNSFYVPGAWLYRDTGYVWRPGYWTECVAGAVWIPAHYRCAEAGYVFCNGYWDYPLEDRGLCFAPVAFSQPLWTQADWSYQPQYCVNTAALLDSLFVQPAWSHYCFGNYFGDRYLQAGFVPWINYGPRGYDPLFSYYRWRHRDDPGWYRGLRNTYEGRYRGDLPVPPTTLAEQNALLRRTDVNRENLRMVTNLNDVSRSGRARLTQLDPTLRSEFLNRGQHFHQLAQERSRVEKSAAAQLPLSPPSYHRPTAVRESGRPAGRDLGAGGLPRGIGTGPNPSRSYQPYGGRARTTPPVTPVAPGRPATNYGRLPQPSARPYGRLAAVPQNLQRAAPRQPPTQPRIQPAARPSNPRPMPRQTPPYRPSARPVTPQRPAARAPSPVQQRPQIRQPLNTPRAMPPRPTPQPQIRQPLNTPKAMPPRPTPQPQSRPQAMPRPQPRPAPQRAAPAPRPQPRPAPQQHAPAPRPQPRPAPTPHASLPHH
jgi:hypothetical protein